MHARTDEPLVGFETKQRFLNIGRSFLLMMLRVENIKDITEIFNVNSIISHIQTFILPKNPLKPVAVSIVLVDRSS